MTTQTINLWEGDGSSTTFSFSFENYDPKFNELEGYVKDADTDVVDPSYTWSIDQFIPTNAVLNKPLEIGKEFLLEIKSEPRLPIWYDANAQDINDDTLNDTNLFLLNEIQAVKDNRTNDRVFNLDMNDRKIINLKAGTNPGDAVNYQQFVENVGDAKKWAEQAEQSAKESEGFRDESEGFRDESEGFKNEAEAIVGGLSNIRQWTAGATYDKYDIVRYETDTLILVYMSKVDNNVGNEPPSNPDVGGDAYWGLVLYTFKGSESFVADVEEVTFAGDNTTKVFDLTALNSNMTPKNNKHMLTVFINRQIVSRSLYTISVDDVTGHSIITFTAAPVAPLDGTFNIVCVAAKPAIVQIKDTTDRVPLGMIAPFSVDTMPQGWLVCDGATVQAATYPDLVEYLNPGQSSATLPDLRGVALRGMDKGRGLDAGRVLNTYQEDTMQPITGTFGFTDDNTSIDSYGVKVGRSTGTFQGGRTGTQRTYTIGGSSATGDTIVNMDSSLVTRTSDETRMKNVSVVYAIKAFGTSNVTEGNIDLKGLNQEVSNLKQRINVVKDVNTWVTPLSTAWRGSITSEGGELFTSDTDLTAHAALSWGNPTFNNSNMTWSCPTWEDVVGVVQDTRDLELDYTTLSVKIKFNMSSIGSTHTQIFGFDMPDYGNFGPLMRMNPSGVLMVWGSTNGTSWDVFSGSLGNKSYSTGVDYSIRFSHDTTTGDILIEWSDDNEQTWNTDRLFAGLTTTPLRLYGNSNGYHTNKTTLLFGGDNHEYQAGRIPPQTIYAEGCSWLMDGKELATPHMISGVTPGDIRAWGKDGTLHQFIGLDSTGTLITEFCKNRQGSDLWRIVGDKRWVMSQSAIREGYFMKITGSTNLGTARRYIQEYYEVVRTSNDYTGDGIDLNKFVPSNAAAVCHDTFLTNHEWAVRVKRPSDGLVQNIDRKRLRLGTGQYITSWIEIPSGFEGPTLNHYINNYGSDIGVTYVLGFGLERGEA